MERDDGRPIITQEMIELYDDYTHLSLDRRKFMDNMIKLAGSASAATAAAALIGANAKAQDMLPETDPSVETEMITYPGDGTEMKGYLAWPAGATAPLGAVIVIHENRGLIPHIKDVTRRVAAEGFLALAPDFLAPLGGTPEDEDAGRSMFGSLTEEMIAGNGVATVEFLKGHAKSNGKVGAMGFCWGGGAVNTIAVHSPDLLAAAPYYGRQPDAEDVPNIAAKMVLHYGGLDERINAGIPAFQAAADAAGTDYELYVYEGANHAFNNNTSEARYHKEAAELAWQRTIDLFRETLG